MWLTFSKSALDEASKALNFSYNKQRASMTFSGSRANLKPNSAYQKVNHWGCNKRKKPMRTYAWGWWKKRENMQLTASAGNVKRAKPRLILLSQLIGLPKFHLRSNWSESVGCRKSRINQLGLTKLLLLEVTKTALTWRPNVNGNITRMPSNYCTTYADKVIKIKNPPLILKQIPLAFSTFQCFLLIAFLTSHTHCEGSKFWNKAEMKQASSKTNSKYSQVYRS